MSPDKLVRMANQIATFFDSQPGGEASEHTVAHLRDFWTPVMREKLRRHAETGGEGLSATALDAARQL